MPQLSRIVQALLQPETYPDNPQQVELVQTQMSFVFLTDNYVYKLKKPVDLGYLDYTTLDKRYFFCQQEVELNRRLCPDAYLGVLPITENEGSILLGGQGKVLEYAVKMLHLPQNAMMNVLLAGNKVSADMIRGVARKLAEFHRTAETSATISAFGEPDAIRTNTDENFVQTEKYIDQTIPRDIYQRIKTYTDGFMEQNTALFRRRVESGRIRDCHGDLHAAHICFTNGVCIYDCIEFNDRFRYCDIASEIAFLAMDLDRYGQADLSRTFIEAYVASSGDKELLEVLDFYKCYRAYVRGKVEGFKLGDPYIPEEEKAKALATARGYYELAESYI
ncbi:phosphotransferase [Chloroflexota bacterium]